MVKILKLDDFLNLPKCNFIKIDVELMEIDVLKGGEKLLKNLNQYYGLKIIRVIPTN